MPEKEPGYDTLKNLLLTAEQRAQLAENRADKAEGILADIKRLAMGINRLLFIPDDMIEAGTRWGERDAKQSDK